MSTETFPLSAAGKINHNNSLVDLIEFAVKRDEGHFASTGALVVETGAHTGRSPNDKFTVRDATTESTLWWDNNKAMTPAQFDTLLADFKAHANDTELFVQDLFAGADPAANARHPHVLRVRLARRLHPSPAAPPRRGRVSPASSPSSRSSTCRASRPIRPVTARAPRPSSPATSPAASC